ncbi:MAG TPA: hypothetical protein VMX94_06935 [Armatimonadota bacterium]|nr:hypothetical protein [Armatimonadota bacterium]
MLKPEALESYLTISDWRPAREDSARPGLCIRCGHREPAVSLCVPCLLEVAARMSSTKNAEQVARAVRRGRGKRRRLGIWEWAVVILLAVGVIVGGSLLSMALR